MSKKLKEAGVNLTTIKTKESLLELLDEKPEIGTTSQELMTQLPDIKVLDRPTGLGSRPGRDYKVLQATTGFSSMRSKMHYERVLRDPNLQDEDKKAEIIRSIYASGIARKFVPLTIDDIRSGIDLIVQGFDTLYSAKRLGHPPVFAIAGRYENLNISGQILHSALTSERKAGVLSKPQIEKDTFILPLGIPASTRDVIDHLKIMSNFQTDYLVTVPHSLERYVAAAEYIGEDLKLKPKGVIYGAGFASDTLIDRTESVFEPDFIGVGYGAQEFAGGELGFGKVRGDIDFSEGIVIVGTNYLIRITDEDGKTKTPDKHGKTTGYIRVTSLKQNGVMLLDYLLGDIVTKVSDTGLIVYNGAQYEVDFPVLSKDIKRIGDTIEVGGLSVDGVSIYNLFGAAARTDYFVYGADDRGLHVIVALPPENLEEFLSGLKLLAQPSLPGEVLDSTIIYVVTRPQLRPYVVTGEDYKLNHRVERKELEEILSSIVPTSEIKLKDLGRIRKTS